MISFIVIGKNEGWKLPLCMQSILNSVQQNDITDYEIIYVDSRSTDGSIEKVKDNFDNVRIFSITGQCNAAIARNIGGKEAKGDILFFLDGDMELQAGFIPLLFEQDRRMVHPFITGINCHHFYNENWEFLRTELSLQIHENTYRKVVGGFFIITKDLWTKIGGLDVRQKVCEDVDFGLRLAKQNLFVLMIAKVGVKHHTIEYMNPQRIWKVLSLVKYVSLLFRNHLFTNKHYLPLFLRESYSMVLLLLCILIMFYTPFSIIVYLILVFARSISRGVIRNYRILPFLICRDFLQLFFLISYFPSRKKIEYRKVI